MLAGQSQVPLGRLSRLSARVVRRRVPIGRGYGAAVQAGSCGEKDRRDEDSLARSSHRSIPPAPGVIGFGPGLPPVFKAQPAHFLQLFHQALPLTCIPLAK
jgi:hypothetical protein